MYVLCTHIPVYSDGTTHAVEPSWYADLILARDWLAPPFGDLTLLAPERPAASATIPLCEFKPGCGVNVVAGMDDTCRARRFWLSERARWSATARSVLRDATVLHVGFDDIWRPMQQFAFEMASSAGVPTVLVAPDVDPHETIDSRVYLAIFDVLLRSQLRRADLALLKEGAVFDRYAHSARNARSFCHTMYFVRDVISKSDLEKRLATLPGRPVRAVYCGRLIARKGIEVTLKILARVPGVEFDVIGSGPEEERLKEQTERLELQRRVRFLGSFPYGSDLLRRLGTYDLLVFTPTLDETPRMLYDGYAAGLPLLATEIPFVRTRSAIEHAAVTFPVGDIEAGAEALRRLVTDKGVLPVLSRRARNAGEYHAVEHWYRQRRDWTIEAVERRRVAGDPPQPARS